MRPLLTSAVLASAGHAPPALAAAIPAAPAAYSENFDSMALGTTRAPHYTHLTLPGGNSTFTNATARPTSADVASATVVAGTIGVFTQAGTGPVSGNNNNGYNYGFSATDRGIGIAPTGIGAGVVQVALRNATGAPLAGVAVAFDMAVVAPGTGPTPAGTEELPGFMFYYATAAGGPWTAVPEIDALLAGPTAVGTVLARFATLTFPSPVAAGDPLLFRWVDDNAVTGSPDAAYALDNVTVIAVPEPTAAAVAAYAGLLAARRRRWPGRGR